MNRPGACNKLLELLPIPVSPMDDWASGDPGSPPAGPARWTASGECGAIRTRYGKLAVRASMVTSTFHLVGIFVGTLRRAAFVDNAAFVPCAECQGRETVLRDG